MPLVGARSVVPASPFYGKYQANTSVCIPSSAPQQYVHIYTLPTQQEPGITITEAQPGDGDPIDDITMASLIEVPEPKE